VYGRLPECHPAVHLGQTPPGVAGVAGRTIDEKGKRVGSWVGGFEVGLPNVSRNKYARKGILGGPPGRHTGGLGRSGIDSNHDKSGSRLVCNLQISKWPRRTQLVHDSYTGGGRYAQTTVNSNVPRALCRDAIPCQRKDLQSMF
jgi:hypothetical protein